MSTLKVNEIQDTSGTVRRGIQTYAIICDEKDNNVAGGTFTSGAWRTRDLNTEIADPDSIVTISSNQFTLGAGTYLIEASAAAFGVNRHLTRIYNSTDSSVVEYGTSQISGTAQEASQFSTVLARVTITGSTAFEIQHRCNLTKATFGFGLETSFGSGFKNKYTVVKIFKEA